MKTRLMITLALTLLIATWASAAPVQNPGNGNWYEVVQVLSTWEDADTAAQASEHLSTPGHLATITSAAEQAWFDSFMIAEAPDNHVHVGGVQDPGANEPADGWEWVTGEDMTYTHWYITEPNQHNGNNEDTMFIFAGNHSAGGEWADGVAGALRWFVVEYETGSVATEPSTWGSVKNLYR